MHTAVGSKGIRGFFAGRKPAFIWHLGVAGEPLPTKLLNVMSCISSHLGRTRCRPWKRWRLLDSAGDGFKGFQAYTHAAYEQLQQKRQ